MSYFQTLTPSTLGHAEFILAFGEIYECSPWVAERVYTQGIDTDIDQIENLHARMSAVLLKASREEQQALINAHPDLAGKAALKGELTSASSAEQAGAGLDHCTPEELARFTALNEAYKATFGFPFIMAVKGSNRHLIIQAFEERIHHTPEQEFACALSEINKIALFRLQQL
ncbi:2-oxo-4-hydroxy-4-carboxy-5-ureidoimidazoline decarboxylase [Pseudomonas asuensis]|uniref:2-oxo-4-hydroxy-4-carboxy-5-ureidoimidazoline decarboxylase n=1 Tax=Pseudomonas asuensis TaxID=1825787 RepID=A0ABQ2GK43_9PSED|nr:2-oxo-4-hydroxy-4-carboxy-5-ureidoimidazoline decarboxylase [Pseudomonas asuensis]GGL99279.1 OHCU decarboxylase [Pseudomonas asuensis]